MKTHLKSCIVPKQSPPSKPVNKCSICEKVLSSKQRLISHNEKVHNIMMETNETSTVIKCSKCNFSHNNPKVVKMHNTKVHACGEKLFCERCDFFCYSPSGLRKHINEFHGEVPSNQMTADEVGSCNNSSVFDDSTVEYSSSALESFTNSYEEPLRSLAVSSSCAVVSSSIEVSTSSSVVTSSTLVVSSTNSLDSSSSFVVSSCNSVISSSSLCTPSTRFTSEEFSSSCPAISFNASHTATPSVVLSHGVSTVSSTDQFMASPQQMMAVPYHHKTISSHQLQMETGAQPYQMNVVPPYLYQPPYAVYQQYSLVPQHQNFSPYSTSSVIPSSRVLDFSEF